MPRLTLAHLQHLHRGAYLRPEVREMESFQLAGLMTLIRPEPAQAGGAEPDGGDAVVELWSLAARELACLETGWADGIYYGLACYQAGWEERGFLYLAGRALASDSGIAQSVAHTALAVKSIPALTFACFVHKGRRHNLPLTLDYVYHTWLPRSGRTLALPWVVEAFGPELPPVDDDDAETAVYLPVEPS
jgi:predicted transcriptional regulator YdeE